MMLGTAEQRLHRLDRHFAAGPQKPKLPSSTAGSVCLHMPATQIFSHGEPQRRPRPPYCLQPLTPRRRALDAYNQEQRKPRLALVTTVWFAGKPPTADSPGEHGTPSHSVHMGDRFLTGWPMGGEWHTPGLDVVSAYVDQRPPPFGQGPAGEHFSTMKGDEKTKWDGRELTADQWALREEEFGVATYSTIAEALRCGGDKLAVDAVLLIGEHGNYEKSEYEQTKYPRYEFFKEITDVFRADGRSVPVFNDKHLSWKWDWAAEMVTLSKELDFPFMAGSSLPTAWRMPPIDMPYGAAVEEALTVSIGSVDSYDFHALDALQCMLERRNGGETGILSVQAARGEQVWRQMEKGSWEAGGWSPRLFEACLSRSHTLSQSPEYLGAYTHRYPSDAHIRELVADPISYRIQYKDGTRATMLLMNGLVGDFNFAAKLRGQEKLVSTLFYLDSGGTNGHNVQYSSILMSGAEKMFLSKTALYPVERTLLSGGMTEAGCKSLAAGGKLIETPYMSEVEYTVPPKSLFGGHEELAFGGNVH